MMHGRKTPRRWGSIFRLVRTRAMLGPFTIADLSLPSNRSNIACQHLVERGEITRLQRGRPGRFGSHHTVYGPARRLVTAPAVCCPME